MNRDPDFSFFAGGLYGLPLLLLVVLVLLRDPVWGLNGQRNVSLWQFQTWAKCDILGGT